MTLKILPFARRSSTNARQDWTSFPTGEIHRDNDMDSMIEAIQGVEVVGGPKQYYFDYLSAIVREPLPDGGRADPSRIVADFLGLTSITNKVTTVSLPGPYSLTKRIRNEGYRDDSDLFRHGLRDRSIRFSSLYRTQVRRICRSTSPSSPATRTWLHRQSRP